MLFRLINLIINLVKSKKFEIFLKKINKINKHKNFGLKKELFCLSLHQCLQLILHTHIWFYP